MQTLSEQLDNEIIPALFEVLPQALPEFGFVKTATGYKSTTGWKVTNEQGDSKGAVSVLATAPFYLKDWTRGGKAIQSYIKERDGLDSFPQVVRRLAELAGVAVIEQQLNPVDADRIEKARRISDAWEVTSEFFINCLSAKGNKYAESIRANSVREYLESTRGYSAGLFRLAGQVQDRDAPRMELGFIPGVPDLASHLRNRSFTQEEINTIVDAVSHGGSRVGTQNILTFPYRDHLGRIRGMVFRTIVNGDEPKYLYSQFKRSEILFNLRALAKDKDLVLVESPLDAMHAAALGIKNIVALGGSGDTLNKAQLDLAVKYGAQVITLMLDNDSQDGVERAGIRGTLAAIDTIQKYYPNLRVFIGQYPDEIKDLDELLVKQGAEGFALMKAEAIPAWEYLQHRIFARYEKLIDPQTGELSAKHTSELEQELIETAAKLSPLDNDRFTHSYISNPAIKALGITKESADKLTKAIRDAAFNKEQDERLQKLLNKAKGVGSTSEALDLLSKESLEIKARNKADSFAALMQVVSESQIKQTIQNKPPVLECNYTLDRDPLLISSSAITLVAGNTGHGKSILLANLAINMAELYPDKTFHVFSYEIDREKYITNLLNTYIGDNDLAFNNRESIEHYFRGKDAIIRKGKLGESDRSYRLFKSEAKAVLFYNKRAEFFSTLIDQGRIKVHYTDFDSDTLDAAIRYLHSAEKVGAVLIDYIQLISAPTGKLGRVSRQEEIKYMCTLFNKLAIDTGLPLIFGAQFNREVNNIVQMKDSALGEAGDLERISDQILGIWNGNKKWKGTPSKQELKIIEDKIGSEELQPNTWYIEVLKRRLGASDAWDIWDYLPNAAKVTSPLL